MLELTRALCKFATGVVADDNEALFARIAQELPLDILRYPSGDQYNGWIVPDNWRVKKATISHNGKIVFDGLSHTLGVARYSKSMQGTLSLNELKPKLITNPELPDAYMFHCQWQYRPWAADWAFCVPYSIVQTLTPGNYQLDLQTEYSAGEMLVAHSIKLGKSSKTIVFNSNTCHPHMANDGFAGTAVLIRLFQWLQQQDTFYSYRLVLGPEHLGSVFYLRDRTPEEINNMVCGIFEEMPGTQGALKACSTFNGGHTIDNAFADALTHYSKRHVLVDWRKGAGNDETVWEAPGYEIPFVEITRCENQFAPFKQYHSSADNADLMELAQMVEMLAVLKQVVNTLEHNATPQRTFNGLICLSNPEFDLYHERPDPTINKPLTHDGEKWGHLLDCLLRYFDGDMTILDIARRHNLPFDSMYHYIKRFAAKGLVDLRFSEIPRQLPKRAHS